MKISFSINGMKATVEAPGLTRLLDVLREDLKFCGTKEGCGEGECGACSVFVGGELVNSCLVPVAQVDGSEVTTIEGVGKGKSLNKIQKAFLEYGGAQCGICTPGMVMATLALLKKNKKPNMDEIREGLAGNLCRCTGYERIFEAVKKSGASP